MSALFLSPNLWIRLFGGLIAASLLGTSVFFPQTLVSVWRYFAAVISASIVAVLAIEHQWQRSSAERINASKVSHLRLRNGSDFSQAGAVTPRNDNTYR